MKDYSLSKEKAKFFVLNYEIKDDLIIVYFASNETYDLPYTRCNEKILLEQMKEQVLNVSHYQEEQTKHYKDTLYWSIFSIIISILGLVMTLYTQGTIMLLWALLTGICFGGGIVNIYKMVHSKRILSDIKKNQFIVEYGKQLNQYIRKNEYKILNTKKKTKEKIASVLPQEPVFTLHTADKFQLTELKKILTNIQNEEQTKTEKTREKQYTK